MSVEHTRHCEECKTKGPKQEFDDIREYWWIIVCWSRENARTAGIRFSRSFAFICRQSITRISGNRANVRTQSLHQHFCTPRKMHRLDIRVHRVLRWSTVRPTATSHDSYGVSRLPRNTFTRRTRGHKPPTDLDMSKNKVAISPCVPFVRCRLNRYSVSIFVVTGHYRDMCALTSTTT